MVFLVQFNVFAFFFLKVVNQNSSQLGIYRLLLREVMLKSHSFQK